MATCTTPVRVPASRSRSRYRRITTAIALLAVLPAAVEAAPRWILVYYRQIGNELNANRQTLENHLFYENGSKASGIDLENQYDAFFGTTDANGYRRVTFDEGNCTYDVRISDPSTPTEQSPVFCWFNPTRYPNHYSYVTHWMKATDETRITTFPQTPVYHYDLVNGLNHADSFGSNCTPVNWVEAPGANSDPNQLGSSTTYQAQTFVVPAGINRIVSAMAFVTRGPGDLFAYRASIRQGSPTGTQVGPTSTSRNLYSGEFKEVVVSWGINDVPVTPGQTYALYLDAPDGQGFNVYRTTSDVYSGGCLYHGTTQVANRDMVAVIVGVHYDTTPPHVTRSPASFTRSVVRKNNLPNDTFTVSNSGPGAMSYSVTDNAAWLSVDPPDGSSAGESDTVNIVYATTGLSIGSYSGTITINAPEADNSPQTIGVNLSVTAPPFAPCDFDSDHDVDQADFGVFQGCYSGSGASQAAPECVGARLDLDEDVDLDDFAKFLMCMDGPNVPVITTCAD